MNISKKTLLLLANLLFGAVLLHWLLNDLGVARDVVDWLLSLLAPFLLGGAIAFIMNVPMRVLERRIFSHLPWAGLRRPLAWLFTLLLLLLFFSFIGIIVVPQLAETLYEISIVAYEAAQDLLKATDDLAALLSPQIKQQLGEFNMSLSEMSEKIAELLESWGELFSSGVLIVNNIINALVTFFVGFVFSIYLLLRKETLARQGKQVFYALLPTPAADKLVEVLRLANQTFANFITGQCTESCILCLLFFVAMLLCHLPYALLISVLIGVLALIPIFGAFIGCAIGVLLILLVSPMQALGFLALFLVLQQVEGNLIYPHVVGSSVGLPSMWVLAAITIGGNMFGLMGMLVFIPLCSVMYALFREFVLRRLREKNIDAKKWQAE